MRDINSLILQEVEDYLGTYDCRVDEIGDLLFHQGGFRDKQKKAIKVVGGVLEAHGKKQLLTCDANPIY